MRLEEDLPADTHLFVDDEGDTTADAYWSTRTSIQLGYATTDPRLPLRDRGRCL